MRVDLSSNALQSFPFQCHDLLAARNGWIWASWSFGIMVYDGKSWRDFSAMIPWQMDIGSGINSVSETSDGSIWIASSLLARYDPQSDQSEIIVPSIPISTTPSDCHDFSCSRPSRGDIGPVFESSDKALWFNQQFDGIVRWDKTTNIRHLWRSDVEFQGNAPIPQKFLQTREGSVWMGTQFGIYRFRDGSWQTWDFGLPDYKLRGGYTVIDMMVDSQDRVWVAFRSLGLKMWDGATWNSVVGLDENRTSSIFQTSSGDIWTCCSIEQTVRYNNGSIKFYKELLQSFAETVDHRLFGAGPEGLFLYDNQLDQWRPYPLN